MSRPIPVVYREIAAALDEMRAAAMRLADLCGELADLYEVKAIEELMRARSSS